ncbi:ATP-binding cassette domain-containing protein [Methanospirillum stamsii]|uniref:Molybdate/tungstate import ATP-binding protein WtpC n=1 Tax=Methanospirillum stamsii TaxID=1277351 RepID=A0A2V2NI47_9EURY|nr:ATP-binding cassette domain-containing protein [Methanospirillum stamsii]PWR76038.1 ABC transporter [Methanospirillum stamsii]
MPLEIRSLSKTLGDFQLRNVSLTIKDSEYFIILGQSGAGKTILLETIAGIHRPDTGRIFLDGTDITDTPARHRHIGMVYQDYMLFPHLNVEKNIGFGLKQLGEPGEIIRNAVEEISALLGIKHLLERNPETLSGGEQQRVAIARALIIRPRVLLLDEPLSALDAITRRKMRTELSRLPSLTGVSVIHITHHAEDLISLGHRSAVMDEGSVIQVGNPDEIFQNPQTPFVAAFTGMENLFSGIARESHEGKIIRVGTVRIHAITPLTGPVFFGIRSEDLIFSREILKSSARNVLKATVTKIRIMGSLAWVMVDCGICLTGVLTVQSLFELEIDDGDVVYITFKASAVTVFPDENGTGKKGIIS